MTSAQANTLKAYDTIAPLYAEYSGRYLNYLNAVDQLVIDRLSPNTRLLDIGSGDGRRLKKISAGLDLTDVVAVEPSSAMAALCRNTTGFAVHELFGDELDRLEESHFDAATLLWNVLGHMADFSVRLKALQLIRAKLKPRGMLLLDVNNRHNALAYGAWKILKRRVIDMVAFKEFRGDVHFRWNIGTESVPSSGHLFTPAEVTGLLGQAGFRVDERLSVNYSTGEVSASPFRGQLFFRSSLA